MLTLMCSGSREQRWPRFSAFPSNESAVIAQLPQQPGSRPAPERPAASPQSACLAAHC